MGRERTQYLNYNRPFESFKMVSRIFYMILIWYEFWFWPERLNDKVVTPEQNVINKTPFWIMSGWQLLLESINICNDRYISTFPFLALFGVYIALYS